MSIRKNVLLSLTLISYIAPGIAKSQQEREGGEGLAEARRGVRTDQYGDPLPQGARARLGTVRWRHPGRVNKVVFSPDGRRLISCASWDNAARAWDVASGKEIRSFVSPEA